MTPPPSLQIQPSRRVTLTFDFLIPKVDHSMPLPVDNLRQFAANSVYSFTK